MASRSDEKFKWRLIMKRKVLVTEKTWTHGYSKPPLIKEIGIGKFHSWGCNYEEFENGPGNYSMAIVEMLDGSIITPAPTEIKFLEEENNLLLTACIKANQYIAYLASEGKLNDQNEINNWMDVQQTLSNAIKSYNGD